MSNLRDRLARLGLAQYLEVFVAEGFDSWDTVLDITESDLSQLGVKLGHRRKLQRAIAETRGQSTDRPLPNALPRATSVEEPYRSEDSETEGKGKQSEVSSTLAPGTAVKRKYRRHPKPDEHAPERPPSAYVIFSNQIRESLRGQDLSFTEIAKIVGERWQVLPADARENCERQANNAKERYYAELAKYKKTPQYHTYQKYLEDFKTKHAIPTKEGKRSKLETETSTSTRSSSSHEKQERTTHRRSSPVPPDLSGIMLHKRESTPPIGPMRLPAGPSYSSKPSSPATLSFSGFNSPRLADPFSPIATSPRSAGFPKETFDMYANLARERKIPPDTSLPYGPFPDHHRYSASRTPPSYPRGPGYTTSKERSSRRPTRESAQLPHLAHEDTTLSSISSNSGHSVFLGSNPTPVLPMESAKTLRILPQPVPVTGSSTSPLDRLPASQQQSSFHIAYPQIQSSPQDFRTEGPLAVLVRAGELVARETEPEPMEEDGNE